MSQPFKCRCRACGDEFEELEADSMAGAAVRYIEDMIARDRAGRAKRYFVEVRDAAFKTGMTVEVSVKWSASVDVVGG